MRTPEQIADDVIRAHNGDPNAVEWQLVRKLTMVGVLEALGERDNVWVQGRVQRP